jgi:phosphoribosylanthranilate isomerase
MLEADKEFMTYYVPEVDNALLAGGLTYENVLKYFNTNQSDK